MLSEPAASPIAKTDQSESTLTPVENGASAVDYQQLVNKLHNITVDDSVDTSFGGDNSLTSAPVTTPPSSPSQNSLVNGSQVTSAEDSEVVLSTDEHGFSYVCYESELQMSDIMTLISKDLSEPYSIYTYRYFIHNWPDLCFLAKDGSVTIGAIVCKLDPHKRTLRKRGYIAMLAIDHSYRRKGIGSKLASLAINAMSGQQADEIVLETEVSNLSALHLYES
ncbi:NAA30 [Bugula neritina]|uniref:NAA30 n=1 Tax=Bugula neritina TaxID=10212 RepID=A0A7J7JAZ2_BUGNE|nr:NAA30 [Bugula neritina]